MLLATTQPKTKFGSMVDYKASESKNAQYQRERERERAYRTLLSYQKKHVNNTDSHTRNALEVLPRQQLQHPPNRLSTFSKVNYTTTNEKQTFLLMITPLLLQRSESI